MLHLGHQYFLADSFWQAGALSNIALLYTGFKQKPQLPKKQYRHSKGLNIPSTNFICIFTYCANVILERSVFGGGVQFSLGLHLDSQVCSSKCKLSLQQISHRNVKCNNRNKFHLKYQTFFGGRGLQGARWPKLLLKKNHCGSNFGWALTVIRKKMNFQTFLTGPWNFLLVIILKHAWETSETFSSMPLKHSWSILSTSLKHPWNNHETPMKYFSNNLYYFFVKIFKNCWVFYLLVKFFKKCWVNIILFERHTKISRNFSLIF